MNEAAKIVSAAVIGYDCRRVLVANRSYLITPPTIHRLAGAAHFLADCKDADTVGELLRELADIGKLCRALSWFIRGDESLAEELSAGTLDEIVTALETAFTLIDVQNFIRLSTLTRSACKLIARV
jgi:hypothetical protein